MFVAIVPAFNEEKHIEKVITELLSHVDEVVVVDDCSSDRTVAIAESLGATVLSHTINRGQGAALQTGHEYAVSRHADYVLHYDGDGQFSVEDVVRAKQLMERGQVDIIFGSRFLGNSSHIPWTKRWVLFPIGRIINYIFAHITLTDVHNGFRVLNKRALQHIVITQDGMAHATEILSLTVRARLRYTEIPIHVYYHEYGQGFRGGIRIVKDLFLGIFMKK